MKWLRCGCCGADFMPWLGYVDQDQDNGFGICESCQEWTKELMREQDDKIRAQVREALNEGNRARWDVLDREVQMGLLCQMLEEGIISLTVPPRA